MLVQLRSKRPDVEGTVGLHVDPADVLLRVEGDAAVFKPSGERLLVLRRNAVSESAAAKAYPFLHELRARTTYNRGVFAGRDVPSTYKNFDPVSGRRIKEDGTLARTDDRVKVRSAVVGAVDRYHGRAPCCRTCLANSEDPEGWRGCFSYIREVAEVFKAAVPDRYEAQMSVVRKTHTAYVVPGTPFTTLTVNNTVSGACHRDAGDYEPGFGVMGVLRYGSYRGCELVFPAYGIAVDLRHRDVILFDAHEVHGNTPFVDAVGPEGDPDHGGYERISAVMYYRTGMIDCLSPDKERDRANRMSGSLDKET